VSDEDPRAYAAPMPQPPPPNAALLASVRQKLKARIAETGIPVARLAERSGVSTGTIWRIIRDEGGDIYLGTLVNLTRVLLIDVRDLLDPPDPE
jgi:transcriptional regulator with XRE-family HTH domain